MIRKIMAVLLALFAAAAFAASVDINTASQAELESVKGIGPAMSAKILAERKKGAFKDWADLVERVPGVGDKSAAKLSTAGLTVGGAAFGGAPSATVAAKEPKSRKPAMATAASEPASAAKKK